ncbi:MAG: polysaccharide deacetylase family protein [Blastocatellia bacterium]|nr:polysaccharide deacetylase family protein [Blastocatellia bacterium]
MLRDEGWQAISLREAVRNVGLERPFPDRSFAITFDDGYRAVYKEAFPILRQLGIPATVFLTVGEKARAHAWATEDRLPSLNGREMLDWSEIREMHESGIFQFGAHTLSHPDLTRLTPAEAEAEMRDSKAIIEDALSTAVDCFAYPFGRYDRRTRDIAARYFRYACSDKLGFTNRKSDLYALERVDSYYVRRVWTFSLMKGRLFPLYINARRIPREIKRAILSR